MSKRIFTIVVLCLVICLFPVLAPAAGSAKEITVSAAISLKNAFEEIGKKFEAKNGAKVVFNFGASGALAQQIERGAPVDVFASAAQKDMDRVDAKGLLVPLTRVNFVRNSVVLVVPSQGTVLKGFEDLKAASIKKIAIGNPKTVPAGRYAAEVLDYFKLSDIIRDKLVFTENVRQVLDYVVRGEVDAGVVYYTDAAAMEKDAKVVVTAPKESHKPIVYPIALIKGTKIKVAAKSFVDFVLSHEGGKILEKHGFKTVK